MGFSLVLALFAVAVQGLEVYKSERDVKAAGNGALADRVARLETRVNGIRLSAKDYGTSPTYGCGNAQRAEPTSLVVMYGIRDGTSCGVPNVNYYKEITLEVPK
jgi:hypothetical protein